MQLGAVLFDLNIDHDSFYWQEMGWIYFLKMKNSQEIYVIWTLNYLDRYFCFTRQRKASWSILDNKPLVL